MHQQSRIYMTTEEYSSFRKVFFNRVMDNVQNVCHCNGTPSLINFQT
jgi:hypothetical protein